MLSMGKSTINGHFQWVKSPFSSSRTLSVITRGFRHFPAGAWSPNTGELHVRRACLFAATIVGYRFLLHVIETHRNIWYIWYIMIYIYIWDIWYIWYIRCIYIYIYTISYDIMCIYIYIHIYMPTSPNVFCFAGPIMVSMSMSLISILVQYFFRCILPHINKYVCLKFSVFLEFCPSSLYFQHLSFAHNHLFS